MPSSKDRLSRYYEKRDPRRTPEPFVTTEEGIGAQQGRRFVVQQHAARRLHWDFRLEIDGVLVSWAVPRGPALDPKEKRLAVHTEDHPIAYGDFEGIIPAGNYGAGAVILWDRGTYTLVDGIEPSEGLARGKIDLLLRGHKLNGRWALIRTKGGKDNEWLLISKNGPSALEPALALPWSIHSGLTVEELRAGTWRDEDLARRAEAAGAVEGKLGTRDIAPMAAESSTQAFARSGWIFELKYDGVRTLAVREPEQPVRLYSRTLRDVTRSFPEVALAIERLPCRSFVLDGEIAAIDERGHPSFPLLQRRLMQTDARAVATAMIEVPVLMFSFDLLAASGYDLRPLPLTTRKALLRTLVPTIGVVRYVDHYEHEGDKFFAAAQSLGIEGIVAKNGTSRYASGRRSREWLKIKGLPTASLAVVGFVPGKGSRTTLGSLMLAWRDGDEFRYAGNVGSGLTSEIIATLLPQLRAAQRATPVFPPHSEPLAKGAVFVDPECVAEVRYTEVLASGVLRHPVFLGLRSDKTPATSDTYPSGTREEEPQPVRAVAPPRVPQLSNVDKIFWPADGYTKGDLLRYYEAVWPALAPYLRDRPVVLTRYPDGIDGKSFFQKNAPEFVPDWVPTHRIEDTDYFICDDVQALLYVINMGCIPLHFWSARRQSLERPDWTILDLDPKGAPFSAVVQVARAIHALLQPMQVPHFIKTSGQDGLHVLVPLGATLGHEHARMLAELIARVITAELPDIATVARPLSERGGKVYVDFGQNGYGKTIVAPFSVRPRPGAPVSTWLDWSEVTARLDPKKFTIRSLPAELERRRGPGVELVEGATDVAALLAALERRLQQ